MWLIAGRIYFAIVIGPCRPTVDIFRRLTAVMLFIVLYPARGTREFIRTLTPSPMCGHFQFAEIFAKLTSLLLICRSSLSRGTRQIAHFIFEELCKLRLSKLQASALLVVARHEVRLHLSELLDNIGHA